MTRTHARFATLLAAAMAASGCATTHFSGEYRPRATGEEDEGVTAIGKETLGKHGKWLFFWGLLDTKDSFTNELDAKVREGYVVRGLEVKDRESVPGVFLWIITAGIVNHHVVELKGHTVAPATTSPAAPTPKE